MRSLKKYLLLEEALFEYEYELKYGEEKLEELKTELCVRLWNYIFSELEFPPHSNCLPF